MSSSDGRNLSGPLNDLGERLARRGVVADVFIVGGAAMALAYDASRVTRDVEARFLPHGIVMEEARRVADDLGLPPWWLNEQASDKRAYPPYWCQSQSVGQPVEALAARLAQVAMTGPWARRVARRLWRGDGAGYRVRAGISIGEAALVLPDPGARRLCVLRVIDVVAAGLGRRGRVPEGDRDRGPAGMASDGVPLGRGRLCWPCEGDGAGADVGDRHPGDAGAGVGPGQ
jgi:hypothetical protein